MSQGEQERFDRVAAAGAVTQLIELLGLSTLADPRRVEAGLGDLLATHPREMNVLVLAAKAGLVEELVAEVRSGTHDKLRQRVAEGELRQHFSLQPSAARLALQCWREGIAGALSGTRQQQLDQQEANVRETSARISTLILASHYKAAQAELLGTNDVLPDMDVLLLQCEARVQEADRAYARAMEPGVSGERRTAFLREALHLCSDHQAALAELGEVPPPPPPEPPSDHPQGTVPAASAAAQTTAQQAVGSTTTIPAQGGGTRNDRRRMMAGFAAAGVLVLFILAIVIYTLVSHGSNSPPVGPGFSQSSQPPASSSGSSSGSTGPSGSDSSGAVSSASDSGSSSSDGASASSSG